MKNFPVKRNHFGLDFFGDSFFEPLFNVDWQCKALKTDITEDGDKYNLEIEIPGAEKNDIDISLEKEYLTVSVKKEESSEEKDNKGRFLRRERYSGSCSRSYFVGDLEEKDIAASYENGILKISFPKESQKKLEKVKKIDIL